MSTGSFEESSRGAPRRPSSGSAENVTVVASRRTSRTSNGSAGESDGGSDGGGSSDGDKRWFGMTFMEMFGLKTKNKVMPGSFARHDDTKKCSKV